MKYGSIQIEKANRAPKDGEQVHELHISPGSGMKDGQIVYAYSRGIPFMAIDKHGRPTSHMQLFRLKEATNG